MTPLDAVLAEVARLSREELDRWIDQRWVRPQPQGSTYLFSEVDIARVTLICELRDAFSIDEEAMPVVLSLLDQVYELRRGLRVLGAAIGAQPDPVRQAIWSELSRQRDAD